MIIWRSGNEVTDTIGNVANRTTQGYGKEDELRKSNTRVMKETMNPA
jgi:hypothetical protein